jgi:chorismate synthase
MSFNSFGKILRFTTFGESHGSSIGCVVDGVPPNLEINEKIIQPFLDRRKPGTNKFVSQRKEADKIKILSGTFEGKSTGTPIALVIENQDQRSKDYGEIAKAFRPGHADFTYYQKYGIRDFRGGGRSSARETAMRVAAGAIAHQILKSNFEDYKIHGCVLQIGPHKINENKINWDFAKTNSLFCPEKEALGIWEKFLEQTRKNGSSAGAIIELKATGIPAGIGSPIYSKLDSEIASALMSINAVKGVEIGSGFSLVNSDGTESSDEMVIDKNKKITFKSNHAGGILGGISSGQDIVARFIVKPTSSILTPKNSIDQNGNNIEIKTKGRHDPCVGIRAVPVGEAMLAFTLADLYLAHKAQIG